MLASLPLTVATQAAPEIPSASVQICSGALNIDGIEVLSGLHGALSVASGAVASSAVLRIDRADTCRYAEWSLGRVTGLRRFTSCHRFVPFWLRPVAARSEAEVRPETLWLLAETADGRHVLIIPFLGGATRYALRAGKDGGLALTGETGDPAVPCEPGVALFVATGRDPYALLQSGARAVAAHLPAARFRHEKALPDFVDLFGWCTWNAFYRDVSPDGILAGLASFAAGGVKPAFVILDDGWQSWRHAPTGEDRLVSLAQNARFGGDLSALVRGAKQDFGVRRFLVWHALMGYTGGLCEQALPEYGVRVTPRAFGPGILAQDPTWNVGWMGPQIGVPAADKVAQFLEDLHRGLAAQGADGVKVDYQGMLEAVSAGQGGRVVLDGVFRRALEASVSRHFGGRMINCMSNFTECVYGATHSVVMRSSDDFLPGRPESHGLHLHANAQVGLWFGEFMQPDWDTFQSLHPRGAFHAVARAASGGPVYVSDKSGAHDFALLKKLVIADGSVLRADLPGRPSPDCLYTDPTRDHSLLKNFNLNRDCGVVGVFNAHYTPGGGSRTIDGHVTLADIPPLVGAEFVGYSHRRDRLWRADRDTAFPVSLAEGEWEIVSFAPIEHGFAALDLADKFNSTGAIASRAWPHPAEIRLHLRDGGRFLAWAGRAPSAAFFDGQEISCLHEPEGRLEVHLPPRGPGELVIRWS